MELNIKVAPVYRPLLRESRYKGVWGGRGSAKSHFFATLLIIRMVASKTDAVCIREIQGTLKDSVKRLIENKIVTIGVSHLFTVLESIIRCNNGGQIIFNGMQNHTAESIKSLEGYDIAWVEEAQSLSNRSLELLRPTIRKPGSELWFSWNPNKASDPIDRLLRGNTPPKDAIVIRANYDDNPWFPDVLRDEMIMDQKRDPDKYAHVWLGEYQMVSDAQVLKGKVSIAEFTPIEYWDGPYFGADWGFSVDPTTLVKLWINADILYIEYEAYRVGVEIDHTPALFKTVPGSEDHVIRADNARPETISYMRRAGFNIRGAVKGKGSVEDGVTHLRGYEKIIIHPRCVHAIEEARLWSYKTDRLSGDILPVLVDAHNHIYDAVRYALEPVMHNGLQGHSITTFTNNAVSGW